jgi:hypothetical protein
MQTSNSSANQPRKQGTENGKVQDVEIAGSVAKAVLAVPEVVSLSSGHSVLAATYGPTHRVTGVVVRHLAPTKTSVEVHVVLRTLSAGPAAHSVPAARSTSRRGSSSAARREILPGIAAQVRQAVFRTFEEMRLPPPVEVDVFVDDII